MTPFNKPCSTGNEARYIAEAIRHGHIAGNGIFGAKCKTLLQNIFGFEDIFLTPSCTTALEIAAMLCEFKNGDEVILPSFTYPGTANAFVRAGAKLVFADSLPNHPNIDPTSVIERIGPRTKAIAVVHYAGMACEMKRLKDIAKIHNLILIEDAAHALGASYEERPLGTWGDMAAFSFHETKNITSGLGGMLVVNNPQWVTNATHIWNQGTNRHAFEKREVPFYTWLQTGGAFHLSELNAAYLYPQLLALNEITNRRLQLWQQYYDGLQPLIYTNHFKLPQVPPHAQHNAHIFYLLLNTTEHRDELICHLRQQGHQAVFHYMPLHISPCMKHLENEHHLPNCERIAKTIIRLPLFDSLNHTQVTEITNAVESWLELLLVQTEKN